jgi:palmitoyltransferase
MFAIGNLRFQVNRTRLMDAILEAVNYGFEGFVYIIGPLLILLALGITALLVHTFVTILVPMLQLKHATSPYKTLILSMHAIYVGFMVFNVLYNYAFCVITRNSGPHYDQVVREMAEVTQNFMYPETPAQLELYKDEYEHKMVMRIRRRREKEQAEVVAESNKASGSAPGASGLPTVAPRPAPIRQWMLLGPYEWGYCSMSHQPKPPRSHYDHVTQRLVLNLDHYCPWMFNSSKLTMKPGHIYCCCSCRDCHLFLTSHVLLFGPFRS